MVQGLGKNITNYDTIIVCGRCLNKDCSGYKQNSTVICDYYSYISAMSLSADNSYSEIDCPDCKSQNSLHVYNRMNLAFDFSASLVRSDFVLVA